MEKFRNIIRQSVQKDETRSFTDDLYRRLLQEAPYAYACHKIILDESGTPVDYTFIEVNEMYEKLTGLDARKIINKNISEILPGAITDSFEWVKVFGEVALNNSTKFFEQYSEALDKTFKVNVLSPQKYYFVTLFTDITLEHHLTVVSHQFNQYTYETIDYTYILDQMLRFSGAKYAAINKFEKDGEDFTTLAVSGIAKNISKALGLLNVELTGKRWKADPYRVEKIRDSKTTFFSNLNELSNNALAKETVLICQKLFNLGEIAIVKTMRNNLIIGDFTLLFTGKEKLQNKNLVEAYADLVGSLMARVDAERERQTETERYMLAVNGSNDGIWDWDIENNTLFFSDRWKEQIGYESDELSNAYKTFEERIHPEDLATVKKSIDDYLQGLSDNYDTSFRFQHKDSSYRFIRARGKGIRNDEGRIIRMAGSHTDITEQAKMEQEIRTSEHNFRSFFQSITDMVFILDLKGNILDVNEAVPSILNFTKEELLQMNIMALHSEEDLEEAQNTIKAIFNGERDSCPLPLLTKEKQLVPVATKIWIEKWNGKDCIFSISRDLSSEQEALQKFNRIFHENPAPMSISSVPERKYLEVNRAFIEKSGYSEDEIIGKSSRELNLFTDLDRVDRIAEELIKNEKIANREMVINTKNGEELHGIFSGHIIHSQGKKYLLTVMMDITAQKEAEETARQANKAKSQFLANMSHEIRTPLNAVIGFTELLLKSNVETKYMNYIKYINTGGNSLLSIVNDILDFSKIEEGKLDLEEVETDIIKVAEEAVDLIVYHTEKKNIELILNIEADVPRFAVIDPIRVKQILTNLLSNAMKFTEEGEIELSLSFSKNGSDSNTGDFLFKVRDTGIGISDENQKKIFNAFTQGDLSITRKYGGTGLGLVISDSLAKKMGSKIEMQSFIGLGSSFSVKLTKSYSTENSEAEPELDGFGKALIINKNKTSGKVLKKMLESLGIEANCIQRLDADQEEFRSVRKYELIIIENRLLEAKDTLLFNHLFSDSSYKLTERPGIVILQEASDSESVHKLVDGFLADCILKKPFKRDEVVSCLKYAFEKARKIKKTAMNMNGIKREDVSADVRELSRPLILAVEDFGASKQLIRAMISNAVPAASIIEAGNGVEAVKIAREFLPDIIFMDIHMPLKDGYTATAEIREVAKNSSWKPVIVALSADITSDVKEKCKRAGMDDYLKKPFSLNELKEFINKILQPKQSVTSTSPLKDPRSSFVKHHDKATLLQKLNGNKEIYVDLINTAIRQIADEIKRLESEVERYNIDEVVFTAHSIKGVGLNLCFDKMAELAKKIELKTFSDRVELQEQYLQLKVEFEYVKLEMERLNVIDKISLP